MATTITGATTTANVDQGSLALALGKKRRKKASPDPRWQSSSRL